MGQTFSIPKPCHEGWHEMTPNDQGRHCGVCCKTVIDFSGWTTEAIANYLATRPTASVCGRIREAQMADIHMAPAAYIYQVMQSRLDFLKKVAAIVLFAVCIGEASNAQTPIPPADTVKPMIMGKMIAPPKAPVKRTKPVIRSKTQTHITGLIAPAPYRIAEQKSTKDAAK